MDAMWKWTALFAVISAAVSLGAAVFVVGRVRHQLSRMTEALEDIENGNGNRRILSGVHELTAGVAFGINGIVSAYEERLARLLQAEETNRQLMTSLSHDVRTPLTTLIGYLDAVHRGLATGQERENDIETARRKAHELKEYIDELFDWFRLNSDEFSLGLQRTEAAELTRKVLIDWIPVLEEAGISFAVDIPEQPYFVRLDADAYARVLNNLIQNVLMHSRAQHISLSLCAQESMLCLRLSDNGVGMEQEDLKHIFERLYKADRGRSAKGSGLGLSIARQLVEKMDGQIDVWSEPGRGTCFELRFLLEN